MTDRANITSIEALESFHRSMVVFREKACTTLDEAGTVVQRFKDWIKHDQKVHWQMEVRARERAFDDARQEWFRCQLADQRSGGTKESAYRQARRALREAEAKLAAVKRWSLTCDRHIDPLARQLERMYNLLSGEMPRSMAYLANVVATLGDYSDRSARAPREALPVAESSASGEPSPSPEAPHEP